MIREDYCHICGEKLKMTFEHVPPSAAHNDKIRKMVCVDSLQSYLSENWSVNGKRYKSFQKGFGFKHLCEKCNNTMGALYCNEYVRIVNGISVNILNLHQKQREEGGFWLQVTIQNLKCRDFFKQALSMFCTINTVQFGKKFKDYLLNKDNNNFDSDSYKMCIYLRGGTVDRICEFDYWNKDAENGILNFSEISFYPIGLILYDLEKSNAKHFYGVDITNW